MDLGEYIPNRIREDFLYQWCRVVLESKEIYVFEKYMPVNTIRTHLGNTTIQKLSRSISVSTGKHLWNNLKPMKYKLRSRNKSANQHKLVHTALDRWHISALRSHFHLNWTLDGTRLPRYRVVSDSRALFLFHYLATCASIQITAPQ